MTHITLKYYTRWFFLIWVSKEAKNNKMVGKKSFSFIDFKNPFYFSHESIALGGVFSKIS